MFEPTKCAVNSFSDHVIRKEKNYDYTWCGLNVDVHEHKDFYELFILAGDDSYHYHNGQVVRLNKNVIYFFKPGESHGLHKVTPQSVHFSFFAKEEFFERFFQENRFFKNLFDRKTYLYCELTDVEYEYLYKLVSALTHQDNEYQKVSLFLYNFISLLMMHNEGGGIGAKNDYVMDVIEKMNNYTFLTTKIQDIYEMYPVARCTLIKEFKEFTGLTIIQYQKKQKLTYAAQLLMNSEYQIGEIAQILEFDSLSHFFRIFKEQYGVTPKEYRKLRK